MDSKIFLIAVIIVSFVVASALNVYPLGYALAPFRPMFIMVVLAFWVLYRPNIMRVWVVFLVGLSADLLLDTHLGHQAFCAVLMSFVIRLMLVYAKELTLSVAWRFAIVALSVFQLTLWMLQSFVHGVFWLGFGAIIMSFLAFPVFWYPLYWFNKQQKERAW